jgi:hypothetical protein
VAVYLRQDSGMCCECCHKPLCYCCKKDKHNNNSKVTPSFARDKVQNSGSEIEEKLAKRWFRPEKFKIMLTFLQIFSQMNNNYGVNWPSITADYMRSLSVVNFDIVKLAALDCLFQSNFYFSLTTTCLLPIGGFCVLMSYMFIGNLMYKRRLNKHHRKCIMTGKKVYQPMSKKFYLATTLRIANNRLGTQEFANADARKQALKRSMDSNATGLPVGSYVIRDCEFKRSDQVRDFQLFPFNHIFFTC